MFHTFVLSTTIRDWISDWIAILKFGSFIKFPKLLMLWLIRYSNSLCCLHYYYCCLEHLTQLTQSHTSWLLIVIVIGVTKWALFSELNRIRLCFDLIRESTQSKCQTWLMSRESISTATAELLKWDTAIKLNRMLTLTNWNCSFVIVFLIVRLIDEYFSNIRWYSQ
jgi:hypothetical protein